MKLAVLLHVTQLGAMCLLLLRQPARTLISENFVSAVLLAQQGQHATQCES